MAYRLTRATWIGMALLAVVVPWFVVARTMERAQPVPVPARPVPSLVWGDRVFSAEPAMARWLRARGVSYHVWLARHPVGAALLTHKQPPPAAALKPPPAIAKTSKRRASAAPAASAASALLTRKPWPPAAAPLKPPPAIADASTQRARTAAAPSSSSSVSKSPSLMWELVVFLVAGLATVLVAFATAPRRVLALVRPEWAEVSVDARIFALAAAFSIGVGALVAHAGG